MKIQSLAITTVAAVAMGAGLNALAQANEPLSSNVVAGETIYVQPTEQDSQLKADAFAAMDADRFTSTALLTIVASNGELTVNGNTTDVAQSSRIETKLKALHGRTKVFAWFDSWAGGE